MLTRALLPSRLHAVQLCNCCTYDSAVCALRTARIQQVMGPPLGLQYPRRIRDRFSLVQPLSGCGDECKNQPMLSDTNSDTWIVAVLCEMQKKHQFRGMDCSNHVLNDLCGTQISHLQLVRKTLSRSFDCIKFVCSLSFLN